jgi:hypothetical protein
MTLPDRSPSAHNLRQLKRLRMDPTRILSVTLLAEQKKVVGFKFDSMKLKNFSR